MKLLRLHQKRGNSKFNQKSKMLDLILIFMCLSVLYVLFYQGKNDVKFLKNIILSSGLVFVVTTFLLSLFDKSTAQPQFTESLILNGLKYPLTHSK